MISQKKFNSLLEEKLPKIDELVVQYEGPKEEPIPPKVDLGDFCPIKFSPFDYFCLPQRKLAAERREYEMSFRNFPYYYYDNT